VVDASGLIFKNNLVTINISTTKIQITKMSLDSLLTDIFHVVTCCRYIFYVFWLGIFYNQR